MNRHDGAHRSSQLIFHTIFKCRFEINNTFKYLNIQTKFGEYGFSYACIVLLIVSFLKSFICLFCFNPVLVGCRTTIQINIEAYICVNLWYAHPEFVILKARHAYDFPLTLKFYLFR